MGVVNVTPDSFSDGGQWFGADAAIARGRELAAQGADIVDVGGESTRPGAQRISEEEELRRIGPVVTELVRAGLPVSIDTMRARVAEFALDAGVQLVNDVSGGLADPYMPRLVAETGVPYVVVHWRGHSHDMNSRAVYQDVVREVRDELAQRIDAVTAEGVDPSMIVLDPGLGFSKLADHNWRLLTRLLEPTGGQIMFDGRDISHLSVGQMRPLRRDIQMIFQDPYSSLNPRHTVGTIVGAPLRVQGVPTENGVKKAVQDLLELVGLNPEHYNRYPHEFSGGQRQRIGVARAIALHPKLIIADEPVSALDVSIRAQVINLLADLQSELGLTYVIIAHDLSVIRHVCNKVAVMYLGRIVESGSAATVHDHFEHPYTATLLSARPTLASVGEGTDDSTGEGTGEAAAARPMAAAAAWAHEGVTDVKNELTVG